MENINIVGDIDPKIWERQRINNQETNYSFHYSDFASDATWSIFIGNANKEYFPNPNSKSIFLLVEPPEIHIYKTEYLQKFDIVVGPKFPQYVDLPNYLFSQIALP